MMIDYIIHPLTPERLPDYLGFFDGEAFSDNHAWEACYCNYYHTDHRKIIWKEQTAAANRLAVQQRVTQTDMQGYLAYAGSKVVGWCNAGPRTLYPAFLEHHDSAFGEADQQVGNIVCFLIAPQHRGQGIATALLNAACAGLRAQGFTCAEAHPRAAGSGSAENYHGPLRMYVAAGFEIVNEQPDGSAVVRKNL